MSSAPRLSTHPSDSLLHSRYSALASNTIDYWMLPDQPDVSADDVHRAVSIAPVQADSEVSLYVHVPFCAQRCAFCAFSGGNSLDFKAADRFSKLVIQQLQDSVARAPIGGHRFKSVNIGGGSPDLLRGHIEPVLRAIRDLPQCTDETEIAVECTLSTTPPEFIDALIQHGVTKLSFGIQSTDPDVRGWMRQPRELRHLEPVLARAAGSIPVINADLITGLSGQDLAIVNRDLRTILAEPRINSVSSYVLTAAAAPALLSLTERGEIPPQAAESLLATMRLHTYSTFLREGWERRGTNTYVDPARIEPEIVERLGGNECIGARRYQDVLIGVGPQAIGYYPGARVENRVDIEGWCQDMEAGRPPLHLPKCSTAHQHDVGLWAFPLRYEGLPAELFDQMVADGALSVSQLRRFNTFVDEGLIQRTSHGYELSIIGEVFMGHLVRDLKDEVGRAAVDEYVAEGHALAQAMSQGKLDDRNEANNRQVASTLLDPEVAP